MKQGEKEKPKSRDHGWCPVYDLACPRGADAAQNCDDRFRADYNPLTSYRDADISHCALYRREQQDMKED